MRTNYAIQKLTNQIDHLLNQHPTSISVINENKSVEIFKKCLHMYVLCIDEIPCTVQSAYN